MDDKPPTLACHAACGRLRGAGYGSGSSARPGRSDGAGCDPGLLLAPQRMAPIGVGPVPADPGAVDSTHGRAQFRSARTVILRIATVLCHQGWALVITGQTAPRLRS